MATGVCYYWNSLTLSGWIKLDAVQDLPTSQARDVMVLQGDVASGTIEQGSAVDFDLDPDHEPWLARNLAVT